MDPKSVEGGLNWFQGPGGLYAFWQVKLKISILYFEYFPELGRFNQHFSFWLHLLSLAFSFQRLHLFKSASTILKIPPFNFQIMTKGPYRWYLLNGSVIFKIFKNHAFHMVNIHDPIPSSVARVRMTFDEGASTLVPTLPGSRVGVPIFRTETVLPLSSCHLHYKKSTRPETW